MVTTVPLAKFPLQLTATLPVAQLMLPPPTTSADSRYVVGVGDVVGVGGGGAGRLRKLAVRLNVPGAPVAVPTVGVHVPVPLQPPVQPAVLDAQFVKR